MIKSTKDHSSIQAICRKFWYYWKTKQSLTELGQETIGIQQYADNMNAVVSLPKDTMNCMSMMLRVLKGATVNQYVTA
jgi:hypothetical protein